MSLRFCHKEIFCAEPKRPFLSHDSVQPKQRSLSYFSVNALMMHLSLMFYNHPVPPLQGDSGRNSVFSPKCFCLLATFAAGEHRNIINIQERREWPALLKSMSEYWPNIDAQSHTAYKYRKYSCGTNITHKQKQKQT